MARALIITALALAAWAFIAIPLARFVSETLPEITLALSNG